MDNNINTGKINKLLELLNSFIEKYRIQEQKLPYHINVLDLVKVNENAHSRIFAKLLMQNEDKHYGVLESLYEYIKKNFPNFNLNSSSPKITTEKDRIDLLILDKEYALIIENKVNNAVDQDSQIARYIQKVLDKGYDDNNIFIIYLTRDKNKTIQDYSWVLEVSDYRVRFEKQYIQMTFQFDILPWLKDYVLPNCKLKDVYLKSSIEQYIDHLEGLFNERKNQQIMNEELQKHLKSALGINSSNNKEVNRNIIQDKLEDIKQLEIQINNLLLLNGKDFFDEWVVELKKEYIEGDIVNDFDTEKNLRKIGIKSTHMGKEYLILLEYNVFNGNIYYGLGRHFSSDTKFDEIKDFTSKLQIDNFISEDDEWWYGWKYSVELSEGFNDLKTLIKIVKNKA